MAGGLAAAFTALASAEQAESLKVRILCLHGAFVNKNILSMSLAPLKKAAVAHNVKLDLIFENGPLPTPVAELAGLLDETTLAMLGGVKEVYSWAVNDDSAAHSGREYSDLDKALHHIQMLLRRHAPVDGLLGSAWARTEAEALLTRVTAPVAESLFAPHPVSRDAHALCACGWQCRKVAISLRWWRRRARWAWVPH